MKFLRGTNPPESGQSVIGKAASRLVQRITLGHAAGRRTYCLTPFDWLPAELWIEVIEEYLSPRQWVALCKICRFFHQIARVCLYKTVILDRRQDRPWTSTDDSSDRLLLFERSLQKRPELCALIHELCIFHALPCKLDELPNLKKLRVQVLRVDANFCDAIHRHPRLTSVELVCCTLDPSFLASRMNYHYAQSSISDLKIILPNHRRFVQEGLWIALAPAKLRSLEISSARRHGDNPHLILTNFMTSGKNYLLENLSINFFTSSIIEVLISSPRLRHFMIHHTVTDHDLHLFSLLPEDAIPLLERYYGPAKLSALFLRNRPVHTVGLTFMSPSTNVEILDSAYVHILDSLQLPSVPVVTLKLHPTPGGMWMRYLPTSIRHLTFPLHKTIFMKYSCPVLSCLPNLRTICGTLSMTKEMALSKEEIMEVSESCPSLQELDVCGYERWIMVKKNIWERFDCQRDY